MSPVVYLTLVGGGVFGNPTGWIVDAVARAVERHADAGLDVVIVSRSRPNPSIAELVG